MSQVIDPVPASAGRSPAVARSEPEARVAIEARGLGKLYRIYDCPQDRLKQMFRLGRRTYGREFWALRHCSLDVRSGEAVGIIGRNGSGKSTLLQLVAGTLDPSEGAVRVRGRLAALLELGSGFNPEFTGRENVLLNGAILGLSRAEMRERHGRIAAFADIGDFMDQPVKTYSSGMVIRLAFAVQAHVEADVLIVDEALAVGDVFFQQKCFAHIDRLRDAGVTILYVSHDLASVERICDRALVLNDGGVAFEGRPSEAVNFYFRALGDAIAGRRGRPEREEALAGGPPSPGEIFEHSVLRDPPPALRPPPALELLAARVCDDDERDALVAPMMGALVFRLLVRAHRRVERPIVGLHLHDRMGNLVFASGTLQLGKTLPALDPGERMVVSFRLELRVSPGEYTFDLLAGEPTGGDDPNVAVVHDSRETLGPLVVSRPPEPLLPFYGIAQLPMTVSCEPGPV